MPKRKRPEWDFDATTTVESNRRLPAVEFVEMWNWYSVRCYWPTRYNGGRQHLYRRVVGDTGPWRSRCGLVAPDLRECNFYEHLPRCRTCEWIDGFAVARYIPRRKRRA